MSSKEYHFMARDSPKHQRAGLAVGCAYNGGE
jgi:hypothetical protein